jgi:hypothetical protein
MWTPTRWSLGAFAQAPLMPTLSCKNMMSVSFGWLKVSKSKAQLAGLGADGPFVTPKAHPQQWWYDRINRNSNSFLQYQDIKDLIVIRNIKCVSYFILPVVLDN